MNEPRGERRTPRRLQQDLLASFVVFLVALPLSLGIALASGAPIMAGLIAAVVGGVVVGALSGAPLQVTGPAAGLVVLVFDLIQTFGGEWYAVCAVVAIAGLIQVALGIAGVARVALAISPAVVHGMLAGIGVLIALGQAHVILGGAPRASAIDNIVALPEQLVAMSGPAAVLGLSTIALLVAWSWVPSARLRRLPAALVAVLVGTLLALGLGLPVERIVLAPEGDLAGAVRLPTWPDAVLWEVLAAAVAVALVASVESLLCAVATDKMHGGRRAHLDRELIAQGVGNTVSGLLGGLPVTGVIVRSSANIAAGATSRASAMLHGLWLLLFVVFLPFVIEAIPKAVLAALLVFIGVKLVNLHHARELRRHEEHVIYAITFVGVVFIDLLSGVGIGIGCALLRLAWRLGHVQVEVVPGELWHVRIRGAMTFLGVPRLLAALGRIPAGQAVRIHLAVSSLDHAGWDAIDGWRSAHERGGGTVHLEGFDGIWRSANTGNGAPDPGAPAGRTDRTEAVSTAAEVHHGT